MRDEFESRFHREFSSLAQGSRGILVGYSGGADSTALLYLLKRECTKIGFRLEAMHVNHGIRGDEADRDECHCMKICDILEIKLHVVRTDIPRLAKESGRGIEETARDFRYESLVKILAENDTLDTAATAHNADDNAETLIFNLSRGCGISGLSGIPREREIGDFRVIRPLLFASKREIIEYCSKIGADYIFDSSNSDTKYSRNFIRSEIIPLLEQLNPSFLDSAARLTSSAREDSEYLDSLAREFLDANSMLTLAELQTLARPILIRVLRLAFASISHATLERVHLDAIAALIKSGGELNLPDRVRAIAKDGILRFTREERLAPIDFELELHEGINRSESPDFAIFADFGRISPERRKKDNETLKNIYKSVISTRLNSDTIISIQSSPTVLYARSRRPGDVIVSGEMTHTVKKLLSGAKLESERRLSLPMICDAHGIILIPGVRIADRAKTRDGGIEIVYYFN